MTNNITTLLAGLGIVFSSNGTPSCKKPEQVEIVKEGKCYEYVVEADEPWETDKSLYEFVVIKNGNDQDLIIQQLSNLSKDKYVHYVETKHKNEYKHVTLKEIDCAIAFKGAYIQLDKKTKIKLSECHKHEKCYKFIAANEGSL